MNKQQALSDFRKTQLPLIKEHYENNDIDLPARREFWNNYVDFLQKDGLISQSQADNPRFNRTRFLIACKP